MKKLICFLMAGLLAFTAVGCGTSGTKQAEETDVVTLKVADWPNKDTKPEEYARAMERKAEFEQLNPGIVIEPDTWSFSVDTFMPKAAANQLPDYFYVPFTEVDKIVDSGYAADLTDVLEGAGYLDKMNDLVRNQVTRDGKVYFFPVNYYIMGLMGNRQLLEEAGELDENGLMQWPQTFEELGELAGRIKAKTGKAGYILPTMKNQGGWHFMNIAWAYGTEFMAQEDGKWVAKFNSPECEAALQFVKDLKWKYNALSDNMFIDNAEGQKMLSTGQGALYMNVPNRSALQTCVVNNGMDPDDIMAGRMPGGPEGRYALLGGSLRMMPAGVSQEKKEAALKWFDFQGLGPEVDEDSLKTLEDDLIAMQESNLPIFSSVLFGVWKSGSGIDAKNELQEKYANMKPGYFDDYLMLDTVTPRAEEPMNAQELYTLLDSCIQAVLEDENADVHQLLEDAANDFQNNYLNNVK